MNMPEDVGGGGLSTLDMCLAEEQFGQTSDALIRRIFGQVYPMLMACTPEQRERYLMPKVAGDLICAMARSEEHTSELKSLMRISYAVLCLKKKITRTD